MDSVALVGLFGGVGIFAYVIKLISDDISGRSASHVSTSGQSIRPTAAERKVEQVKLRETVNKLIRSHESKEIAKSHMLAIVNELNDKETADKYNEIENFKSSRIRIFCKEYIISKPFFKGDALNAVIEVLKLLDVKGECPSVVGKHSDEPERRYESIVYSSLKTVTLAEHSINVAEEIIKYIPADSPSAPKYILSALTHDLGKIAKYYDELHSVGTHQFLSVMVIDRLGSLAKLKYIDHIIDAVRGHHSSPQTQLGKDLKKADQTARRFEFRDICNDGQMLSDDAIINVAGCTENEFKLKLQKTEIEGPTKLTNQKRLKRKTMVVPPVSTKTISSSANIFGEGYFAQTGEVADLLGTSTASDGVRGKSLQRISIPWFDVDQFLKEIFPIINRLQEGQWFALSLKGTVYLRPELLFSAAQKLSNSIDLQIAGADQQMKDDVIFSMVSKCRDAKLVENTMFNEKYYGALFIVNPDSSSAFEAYLTPFRLEAWGNSALNLEHRKPKQLAGIRDLKPKFVLEAR